MRRGRRTAANNETRGVTRHKCRAYVLEKRGVNALKLKLIESINSPPAIVMSPKSPPQLVLTCRLAK